MRVSRFSGILISAAVATTLVACSASNSEDSGSEAAGSVSDAATGFPISVEHVYGTTVIEDRPERVATVAWSNQEVPLALGIVPVGMPEVTWGDDDNDGVLPWVEERLEELGAETPALFDETDGIDFAAVAETNPDVILAAVSGLSQEEYDTLSKIAPVVAYPEIPWGTSLEDMILLNSRALGLEAQGKELVTEIQAEIDSSLKSYPGLADQSILFSFINPSDMSSIGMYTVHDTRPGFLAGLGFPQPEIIQEESEGTQEFYTEVSAEAADRFDDVDVFVTYGDPEGDLVRQLQADPLISKIPAVAEGRIAILEENTPLAASANPSPLSISWGVDKYFEVLNSAVTTK